MAPTDPWPTIHAERAALAADLEPLTDEQWATPSLCALWSVRDVLAHLTATAKMTPGRFFLGFLGSGFRFNAMTAKDVRRERGATPGDTLAGFVSSMAATTHPPGPIEAMLGEMLLHGEDIRRPLGIAHTYAPDAVVRVADFYKGSNLILHSKSRVAGLTLKASDAEWSTGAGAEVTGPLMSLLLAMTGRKAGLADLSGEGLATLSARA